MKNKSEHRYYSKPLKYIILNICGQIHSNYEPAVVYKDGCCEYYLNGKKMEYEEWIIRNII